MYTLPRVVEKKATLKHKIIKNSMAIHTLEELAIDGDPHILSTILPKQIKQVKKTTLNIFISVGGRKKKSLNHCALGNVFISL